MNLGHCHSSLIAAGLPAAGIAPSGSEFARIISNLRVAATLDLGLQWLDAGAASTGCQHSRRKAAN